MSKPKHSLAAEDWLDEALNVMATEGVKAVAVEPLAKRLGVTKGSFYWHFKNRDALITELLAFWERIELEYINDFNHKFPDPIQRLKAILEVLVDDETNKYIFLALANGVADPMFDQAYRKAVIRRIQLFENTLVTIGSTQALALVKAHKLYCQYFGLIKLAVDRPTDRLSDELYSLLKQDLLESFS